MKSLILSFIVAALICTTGCITSRSPDCADFTLQLQDGNQKKSIAYSFFRSGDVSVSKDFNPYTSTPAFAGAWAGAQLEMVGLSQFKAVFEHSATSLMPTVNDNQGECDILIKVHQQNTFNSLTTIPAFFSGFSLYLIPCWGDDVYYLSVVASNKSGLKKNYLIRRKVTTSCWLPFILAMPFVDGSATAVNKITIENWKELRCAMERDGFFAPTPPDTKPSKLATSPEKAAQSFADLKKLKEQGVLSKEEYDKAVERIK